MKDIKNIKNYDEFKKVCDDDDLIQLLYDEGLRPGTKEFEEELGCCATTDATLKDYIVLFGAIGGSIAVAYGVIVGVNWICRQIGKGVSKGIDKIKIKRSKKKGKDEYIVYKTNSEGQSEEWFKAIEKES